MTSGEKLRTIRQSMRMSQCRFGEYLGIPVPNIQKWEQGITNPPDYVMNLILKVLPKNIDTASVGASFVFISDLYDNIRDMAEKDFKYHAAKDFERFSKRINENDIAANYSLFGCYVKMIEYLLVKEEKEWFNMFKLRWYCSNCNSEGDVEYEDTIVGQCPVCGCHHGEVEYESGLTKEEFTNLMKSMPVETKDKFEYVINICLEQFSEQ